MNASSGDKRRSERQSSFDDDHTRAILDDWLQCLVQNLSQADRQLLIQELIDHISRVQYGEERSYFEMNAQQELAAELDVSEDTITRLVKGKSTIENLPLLKLIVKGALPFKLLGGLLFRRILHLLGLLCTIFPDVLYQGIPDEEQQQNAVTASALHKIETSERSYVSEMNWILGASFREIDKEKLEEYQDVFEVVRDKKREKNPRSRFHVYDSEHLLISVRQKDIAEMFRTLAMVVDKDYWQQRNTEKGDK